MKGFRVNEALTSFTASMVTLHVPVPVQAPLQPVKVEFHDQALKVTTVLEGKLYEAEKHEGPQYIPLGELLTVPFPEPALEILRALALDENDAVTDLDSVIVTTHKLPPEQAPPHPANVEFDAGVAVRVTTESIG